MRKSSSLENTERIEPLSSLNQIETIEVGYQVRSDGLGQMTARSS
jgi:hypothetical protein